jgi:hypothetical protein
LFVFLAELCLVEILQLLQFEPMLLLHLLEVNLVFIHLAVEFASQPLDFAEHDALVAEQGVET